VAKPPPLEVSIESRQNDALAVGVGSSGAKFHDISKELSFVYSYDVASSVLVSSSLAKRG